MKKITTPHLAAMKARGEKIAMVTAYDHTFSRILNQAQVEIVLVGDSLGMVIQGHDSTLPVTMEEMVYHTRIVARGAAGPLVVADMPFMSYQASREQALVNAGRLMKEGMAGAVKLEGGVEMADIIRAIAQAGIPVMGHVGLRPQSVHQYGGFKIQGRKVSEAERILADAQAVAEAGAFALVIEGVPAELAARITGSLPIPTIGIGAGAGCDGQVLVIYDLLGMDNSFNPKFAKKYANLHDTILDAVQQYVGEVKSGAFPGPEHAF